MVNVLPVHSDRYVALLSEVPPEGLRKFRRDTINAIIAISAAYAAGAIFFTVLFLQHSEYWFFAVIFPMFCSLWLYSFGAGYVNNDYGLKKTTEGTVVYRKVRQNYTTLVAVHAVISLVSLVVRLIYEISNLALTTKELRHKNGN